MNPLACLTANAAPARAMHPSTDSGRVPRVAVGQPPRTMTNNTHLKLLTPLLALTLAGCVSTPMPPDSSASHPANPQAASSPVPPLQPGLLAITNMVMVKPVTNAPPEHQHGHGQHETKPKTEETK